MKMTQTSLSQDFVTELARRLIRTPSPSLKEEAVSRIAAEEMRALDYDEVRVDELFNVVGVLKGSGEGPTLMFNGHLDHAEPGEMIDPYAAEIRAGEPYGHEGPVIYGRGASDMKGAVAAMICAGGMIKQSGVPLKGDVLVTCVSREEMARGEGIRHLLASGIRADCAVSGEASNLNVYVGHRGKWEAKVTVRGQTSHGGYPQGGINAIFKMNQFLNRLQQDYQLPHHRFLGQASVTALDITASPGALTPTVPDRCEVVVDRRFFPEETEADLLDGLRELIQRIQREDPKFQAEVETLKWFPAMYTDPNQPVVKGMLKVRERALGDSGEIGSWYFGVDGTFLNQAGIPCVGLGPGDEYLAHTPDDVVPIQHLKDAVRVYAEMIQEMCGSDKTRP